MKATIHNQQHDRLCLRPWGRVSKGKNLNQEHQTQIVPSMTKSHTRQITQMQNKQRTAGPIQVPVPTRLYQIHIVLSLIAAAVSFIVLSPRSTQASPLLTSLLSSSSSLSSSSPLHDDSLASRLFIPNRLASYVNYNRHSIFNNHYTPADDTSDTNNRPRWVTIFRRNSRRPGSPQGGNFDNPPPLQPSASNVVSFLFNNLSSRIGLRNSVRISNVLRDLAWQILARLSIPTPVIYELRRMNIYSQGEQKDPLSIFGNNSITIRSKKALSRPKRSLLGSIRSALTGEESEDDDEIEPPSIVSRLTDMLDRNNRPSLVGRVIRLPFWLPFRRGEQGGSMFFGGRDKTADDDGPVIRIPEAQNNMSNMNNNKQNDGNKSNRTHKRQTMHQSPSRQANRNNKQNSGTGNQKRARGERMDGSENRPLISVDGKSYYLDDENKLRAFN